MFSKNRNQHSSLTSTRSSLKRTTNNDSSITLTKDRSSVITIPVSSTTNSNFLYPSTTTNTSTQNTSQSMKENKRYIRNIFYL